MTHDILPSDAISSTARGLDAAPIMHEWAGPLEFATFPWLGAEAGRAKIEGASRPSREPAEGAGPAEPEGRTRLYYDIDAIRREIRDAAKPRPPRRSQVDRVRLAHLSYAADGPHVARIGGGRCDPSRLGAAEAREAGGAAGSAPPGAGPARSLPTLRPTAADQRHLVRPADILRSRSATC